MACNKLIRNYDFFYFCCSYILSIKYNVIRTNLLVKVAINAKFERKSDIKVQGFGPRTSHTGLVRDPVIKGGNDALTEQSKPREPATQQSWMTLKMQEKPITDMTMMDKDTF